MIRACAKFLFLFALLTPTYVHAFGPETSLPCPAAFHRFGHKWKLIRVDEAADYTPIARKKVVKASEVRMVDAEVRRELDKMGVRYTDLDEYKLMDELLEDGTMRVENATPGKALGSALRVDQLPKKKGARRFSTPTLLHPDLPAYLEKMKEFEATLVVDSTLKITGNGGYHTGVARRIGIRANTPWGVFLHEYQHLEFHWRMKKHFARILELWQSGKKLRESLGKEVIDEIGPEKIDQMQWLLDRGVTPQLAINESLSTFAEMKALGMAKYLPEGFGPFEYQYMLRHQISELQKLGKEAELSVQQLAYLEELKKQHASLDFYRNHGVKIFGGGILGTTASVTGGVTFWNLRAREQKFRETYADEVSDRLGHSYALRRDNGRWECVSCSPGSPYAKEFSRLETGPTGAKYGVEDSGEKIFLGYFGYENIQWNKAGELWGQKADGSRTLLKKVDPRDTPIFKSY